MNTKDLNIDITEPKKQLRLYGYKNYFQTFIKLFIKNMMPHSILITGPRGIGKSTFVYHIVNYLLSLDEDKKYSINNFLINKENSSFNLINNHTHPNFFLVENQLLSSDIKIEQIRKLNQFINKSTYSRNLKIIMIDNAENLNLNASNALLKSLEEPPKNTFFFLIHNSGSKILDTIKSRCVEFKIFFNENEKKNIFKNLINQHDNDLETYDVLENLYFDTPGNSLRYLVTLSNSNEKNLKSTLSIIFFFIEKLKNEKKYENLFYLSFFIQKFYNELILKQNRNLNVSFLNYKKILCQINNMKKFNLDKTNTSIWLKDILINETK